MPNNPDLIPTSVHLSPQQFIAATANIPLTINAPTFINPMGEFFRILELEFSIKKKFFNSPPSLDRRMKPSRCSIGGFSSSKRILKASQTWKLPIDIFVRWKVLQHACASFATSFLQNLAIRTLC